MILSKATIHSNIKKQRKLQISYIVSEYVDLVHEYDKVTESAPIWDLASLLYFPTQQNNLAIDLNGWITEYDPLPEYTEAEEDPDEIREIARHNMMRGNLIEAIEGFEMSTDDLNEIQLTGIKAIIELLEKFQTLQEIRDDPFRFVTEWSQWHTECQVKSNHFLSDIEQVHDEEDEAADDDDQVNDDIAALFYILLGDEDHISFGGSYFERLIAYIIFARPEITMSDLNSLAQRVVTDQDDIDACAYMIMGCFDDAFEACQDLWLQTHLGHALILVGAKSTDQVQQQLEEAEEEKEFIIDPIYYCIDEYATMLAENHGLWKEAVIYITACVENKELWIKKLLNENALKSKDMSLLNTLLEVAKEYNLNQLQKYIHQMIGHRYEDKKEIQQATIEYGKAHDMDSLDRFAHHEFSQYLKTGKLGHVVTNMDELKESPHYALLILYHNFRELLEKKDWSKASKLFLELLGYEHLPKKFEMVLLTDNLAILEDSGSHYTLEQLIDQIKLFSTVTTESIDQDFLAKYYKFVYHKELSSTIVTAIVRERMVNKAVIASN
ncbi:nucleoporin Nup85-like protein [Pilaira anomala]|nr:nucleoporin Nup85-like protein [Pilaira anomala]